MEEMMAQVMTKRYTTGEEIVNAITHGIGALLSIAGLVLLIIRAVRYAPEEYKGRCIVGFTIFGASLIVLYLFSTLYHALPLGTKKVFGITVQFISLLPEPIPLIVLLHCGARLAGLSSALFGD